MINKDIVSKTEVLDIYAELYDEFDDAPGVIRVLHKVCDKLKRLQSQDIVLCKDCKHRFNGCCYDRNSNRINFGVYVSDDWFCADGERN